MARTSHPVRRGQGWVITRAEGCAALEAIHRSWCSVITRSWSMRPAATVWDTSPSPISRYTQSSTPPFHWSTWTLRLLAMVTQPVPSAAQSWSHTE